MTWVKSEYAPELAVLSTWLSMLLPWSLAYHSSGPLGSILVFFRFSVFELQLRFPSEITFEGVPLDVSKALDQVYSGFEIGGNFYATVPPLAAIEYTGPLAWAYGLWSIAALVLLVAFTLSLSMYRNEEWTAVRLPYPYPRLTGGLLAAATVLLALSSVLMGLETATVGFPLPVGLLVMGALAVTLLRVELVEDS